MECEQFREMTQDLARGAMRERAGEARAHAESCPQCDALLQGTEAITTALRALAAGDASVSAPDRVRKNLLRILAQRRKPSGRLSDAPRLAVRMGNWSAALAATATAALFVIAMAPPRTPAVLLPGSPVMATVSSGRLSGMRRNFGPTIPAAASAVSQAAPAQWASAFAGDEADTQPFVPLSDSFDPASLGDDAVVRVVVPRETLQSLGVSLGEDATEQVVADVIVTADGTPQAVRVLRW